MATSARAKMLRRTTWVAGESPVVEKKIDSRSSEPNSATELDASTV